MTSESRSSIGLRYFTYALCLQCFHALTTLLTNDETLVQNHCIALTEDGVHAAATLLHAYRMGSEGRMSQADAAWVRNVIAFGENYLPGLLRDPGPVLTE